jgi:hypothetical protein
VSNTKLSLSESENGFFGATNSSSVSSIPVFLVEFPQAQKTKNKLKYIAIFISLFAFGETLKS